MPFLNVHEAIGAALVGVDVEHPTRGRPETDLGGQRRGMSAPAFDGRLDDHTRGPKSVGVRYVSINGVKTEIHVYHMAPRGRQASETWPCISYELVGIEPNPERYVYKADRFRKPVRSSYQTVTIEGKTYTGPTLREVRDNPEPFDLVWQIEIWAKKDHHALLLNKALLEVFPMRGALKAMQEDGTPETWEMYLRDVAGRDQEEPTLEDQLQREYHWVYTYVVETFLDNTLVTDLRRTITNYEMAMEAI